MAEPLIGKTTLPRLWMYICQLWIIVAVGAIAMVIAVWMMILIQNIDTFQNTMGTYMGNDVLRYPPGDPNNGYVNETNIPKHLGGPVFAAAFDVAMIVFCLIAVAADVFYKFSIAKQILEMMFAVGLWSEAKMTEIEYFFLIANAFLKLFIVAATGAQTYVGIDPNNDDVDTPLFCLYATFILLGSIPLTVIASMFIIQRNKKGEYEDALKAAEAGKK